MEDIFYLALFGSIFVFILVKMTTVNSITVPSFFYVFNKQSLNLLNFSIRFFFFFQTFITFIKSFILSTYNTVDSYSLSSKLKLHFLVQSYFESLMKDEYSYLTNFSLSSYSEMISSFEDDTLIETNEHYGQ